MNRTVVTVVCETELMVSSVQAWALVRDFDAMPAWNETVRHSHIENGPADRVGCRRVLVFDDGSTWTHQLTGLSDIDMKLQYSIVETPQPMNTPIWNYHAEMRVIPIGDEKACAASSTCTIEWRAKFETLHPEEMTRRARQVFESGFAGLRRQLAA